MGKRKIAVKRETRKHVQEIKKELGCLLVKGRFNVPNELLIAIDRALTIAKKYLPDGDLVCDSCGGRAIPGDPVTCEDCDYVEEGWDD